MEPWKKSCLGHRAKHPKNKCMTGVSEREREREKEKEKDTKREREREREREVSPAIPERVIYRVVACRAMWYCLSDYS